MLIGRTWEREELERLYQSDKAELAAVYGRRGVGKTYLVEETFRGRITFRHTGLPPWERGKSPLKSQLDHFYLSLLQAGMKKESRSKSRPGFWPKSRPKSWMEAFYLLLRFLDEREDGGRQLVFLDEMPWMDTPKSGFLTAFEGFWNTWGSRRNNLMVVICGSANAWILDNLINSRGGLYNRVTCPMKLKPFTLRECEEYFHSQQAGLSRRDIAKICMMAGGIPLYLGYYTRGLSPAQNAEKFFSGQSALRKGEYDRLFSITFEAPEEIKKIVELLSRKKAGLTRKELASKLGISDGETLSKRMHALVASDFVLPYVPFGFSKRQVYYKLMDPFCLFWLEREGSPALSAWRELAPQNLCFTHVRQIKRALGVEGVQSVQSAWLMKEGEEGIGGAAGMNEGNEDGTRTALLIKRRDHVVNLCEIRFAEQETAAREDDDRLLWERAELLKKLSPGMTVRLTLITAFGLPDGSCGAFADVVTLDDLFA